MKKYTIMAAFFAVHCVSMASKPVAVSTFDKAEATKILSKEKAGFFSQSQLIAKRQFVGSKFARDESGCFSAIGIESGSMGSGNNITLTICPKEPGYTLKVSQDVNGVFKMLQGDASVSIALSSDKKYVKISWDGDTVETGKYATPRPFAGVAVAEIDL